jgi:hypothetical protein
MIIRASSTPGYNDCARRTAARLWSSTILAHGFALRETYDQIGAAVGIAVHLGAASFLKRKKRTGDNNLNSADDDAVIEEIRERTRNALQYDTVSQNRNNSEKQSRRMLAVWHTKVGSNLVPLAVEEEVSAKIDGGRHTVLGHSDARLCVDPLGIDDLKTGIRRRSCKAQLGTYANLDQAHGHEITRLRECFVPRVPIHHCQPPPQLYEFDVDECKKLSRFTVRRMFQDFNKFESSGNPEHFPANPWSQLCSARYCPAHSAPTRDGKRFCTAYLE